jgi:acyl-CoA thioester hydrolase
MLTHASSFRVQIFDLDAYGELRTNCLLRFMQQTASDASAAAGFDVEWYEQAGTLWVIRRTIAEFLAPILYRDELEVRTWVSDLRRVRSQREYEIRRIGDAALVARGSTDWVYVDLLRGAPQRPPDDMVRKLMPDLGAQARPPRAAVAVPEHAVHVERRVELADLDSVAHVNNAHYAVYVEQALFDALAACGWRVDPTQRAARPRALRHDLEYFAEAQYGDALDAAVWISAANGGEFSSECMLSRQGARLLHAASRWAWSDGQLPGDLTAALSALAGRSR